MTGIEPSTLRLRVRRAPSWAISTQTICDVLAVLLLNPNYFLVSAETYLIKQTRLIIRFILSYYAINASIFTALMDLLASTCIFEYAYFKDGTGAEYRLFDAATLAPFLR